MRFLAGGPSIPDELLLARDREGIVFFCGSGVSRAFAELPDFYGLSEKVADYLRVDAEDPSRQIVREAQRVGSNTGVDGLISADKVFAVLERDFRRYHIHRAVAKALKPPNRYSLRAHRVLLKLATSPLGHLRIVTTNFDRLFEKCQTKIRTFEPNSLPNLHDAAGLNGIVYLHGRLDKAGVTSDNSGLVLSSSEFGEAYISGGWALSFFKEILRRNLVVFIGYSADDPPVQYLLEAMFRTSGPIEGAFAFQSGNDAYAASKWQHKGVTAIPYDGANKHAALWDTLEAWAERAEDPQKWISDIIDRARSGPTALQPFERGQVAHCVSTLEGARHFAQAVPPLPAEWLYTFDRYRRYARPGDVGAFGEPQKFVDPFDLYHLDSDPIPERSNPNDRNAERIVPEAAWSAFDGSRADGESLLKEASSRVSMIESGGAPSISARQKQLAFWVGKIASAPLTVWWAGRQIHLQLSLLAQVQWEADRETGLSTGVREAWFYLLDYYADGFRRDSYPWHSFKFQLASCGWNPRMVRRFREIARPYFKVSAAMDGGVQLAFKSEYSMRDLLWVDVRYPKLPAQLVVPPEFAAQIVRQISQNLDIAVQLENEIGGFGLRGMRAIRSSSEATVDDEADDDLNAWLEYYVGLFLELISIDLSTARNESLNWNDPNNPVHTRLRIWCIGEKALLQDKDVPKEIQSIPKSVRWDSEFTPELLWAIRNRWRWLDSEARATIQQIILEGPEKEDGEGYKEFLLRKAATILNCEQWLRDAGCEFDADGDKILGELRGIAVDWEPHYAEHAISPRSGSRAVKDNHSYDSLVRCDLKKLVSVVEEHSRYDWVRAIQYNPFAGLSRHRPVRALAALRLSAEKGDIPRSLWQTFLRIDFRRDDSWRLACFIGEVVARLDPAEMAVIWGALAFWFEMHASKLSEGRRDLYFQLISHFAAAQRVVSDSTCIEDCRSHSWGSQSLVRALMNDSKLQTISEGDRLDGRWIGAADVLIETSGQRRSIIIEHLAKNLAFFYRYEKSWTEENLLIYFDFDSDIHCKQAGWLGFFEAKSRTEEVLVRVKDGYIALVEEERPFVEENVSAAVNIALSAWSVGRASEGKGQGLISDTELRRLLLISSEPFRVEILKQISRFIDNHGEKWIALYKVVIGKIWPLQIVATSPKVAALMLEAAFSDNEGFMEMTDVILPLLDDDARFASDLVLRMEEFPEISSTHPSRCIELISRLLPDDSERWPISLRNVLETIERAGIDVETEQYIKKLRGRLNA